MVLYRIVTLEEFELLVYGATIQSTRNWGKCNARSESIGLCFMPPESLSATWEKDTTIYEDFNPRYGWVWGDLADHIASYSNRVAVMLELETDADLKKSYGEYSHRVYDLDCSGCSCEDSYECRYCEYATEKVVEYCTNSYDFETFVPRRCILYVHSLYAEDETEWMKYEGESTLRKFLKMAREIAER